MVNNHKTKGKKKSSLPKKTFHVFDEKIKPKSSENIRFPLFKKTIEISIKRKHKVIVETGTSRGKKKFFFFKKFNWKDGMSTIIFSEYAKFANGKLHSCDLSKENIKNATDFTKEFSNNVQFYVEDSVVFLKNFNQKM